MSRIIISYRRADSAAIAGRIFDRLSSHYGDESVFMDIDKIPFGTDFREHIRKVLLNGDILLAVIGPSWLGKTPDGGSRLKDEADPVRVEIETALRQGTTVIPVLIEGATMPSSAELPESIRDLAYLNAAPLDIGRDFRQHMDRLIRSIDARLGESSVATPAAATGTTTSSGSSARLRVGLAAGAAAIVLVAVVGWALTPQRWFAAAPPPERSPVNAAGPVSQPDVSRTAQPDLSKLVPPDLSTSVQPRTSNVVQRDVKNAAAPVRAEPELATYRILANVSGGVQNLRGGPAVKYPLVVAIPAGATGITIGTCRASEDGTKPWCAAKWRNHSGWISSCCIVDEKTGALPRID